MRQRERQPVQDQDKQALPHAPQSGRTSRDTAQNAREFGTNHPVSRTLLLLLAAVGALALASVPAAARGHSTARLHRLHVPPPPADTDTGDTHLASGVAVSETEWAVRTSRTELAAGEVTIRVYNIGMDDHDIAIADDAGKLLGQTGLKAGTDGTLKVTLAPGHYKLYCTLFGGTSESHETKGMLAFVDVKTR